MRTEFACELRVYVLLEESRRFRDDFRCVRTRISVTDVFGTSRMHRILSSMPCFQYECLCVTKIYVFIIITGALCSAHDYHHQARIISFCANVCSHFATFTTTRYVRRDTHANSRSAYACNVRSSLLLAPLSTVCVCVCVKRTQEIGESISCHFDTAQCALHAILYICITIPMKYTQAHNAYTTKQPHRRRASRHSCHALCTALMYAFLSHIQQRPKSSLSLWAFNSISNINAQDIEFNLPSMR